MLRGFRIGVRLQPALAKEPWATNLKQIPATVIDVGNLRFVPYVSYRCGEDYEVNVYGDPEAPSGVEIGVYRSLLSSEQAKDNCLTFIRSVLGDSVDAAIVGVLDRQQDLVTRKGLTIEITPPTGEDAYGGWWISVYDVSALDAARASKTELADITVPKKSVAASDTNQANDPSVWTSSDIPYSRSNNPTTQPSDVDTGSGGYNGGDVYVRGYYRKDGTYVHSYTRSSPGYGGGRHR